MSYLPVYSNQPSAIISLLSPESLGLTFRSSIGGTILSTAYSSANRAYYSPISLRQKVIVTGLVAFNGATASGNFDIGIYSVDGTKIISTGSTAQSGTSTLQNVSITPTTIGPGVYYIGFAASSTGATYYQQGNINGVVMRMFGVYIQASALPLPATATFASMVNAAIPVAGLLTVPTV